MHATAYRAKGRRAFTLIELLVVVSIIALLISILLPSLRAARGQAKSAVCLSNLKRIGLQGTMYVHAYRAHPPVRLKKAPDPSGSLVSYYHDFGGKWRRQAPRWQWFLSESLGPVISPTGFDDEESFNKSMKIDNKFWEDPAMKDYRNDVRNGAYGYNGTYLGNTRDDGSDWMRFPVAEARVTAPSRTIYAGDSRGGLYPHGDHSYWLDPPKRATYGGPLDAAQGFGPNSSKPAEKLGHSPVEARHNGAGNVVFVDGHAESKPIKAYGYHVEGDGTRTVPIDRLDRTVANNRRWTGTGRDDLCMTVIATFPGGR